MTSYVTRQLTTAELLQGLESEERTRQNTMEMRNDSPETYSQELSLPKPISGLNIW